MKTLRHLVLFAAAISSLWAQTMVPSTRKVNGHALNADVTVTKSDVGLPLAENTSDANKPISSATQTALNAKQSIAGTLNFDGFGGITGTLPKANGGFGQSMASATGVGLWASGAMTMTGTSGTGNFLRATGAAPSFTGGTWTGGQIVESSMTSTTGMHYGRFGPAAGGAAAGVAAGIWKVGGSYSTYNEQTAGYDHQNANYVFAGGALQVFNDSGPYYAIFNRRLALPAATTSNASLTLPHGTAPTAPNNGDLWTTTAGLFGLVNGSTVQFATGGGTATGSNTGDNAANSNSGLVHTTGTETVGGAKTFTGQLQLTGQAATDANSALTRVLGDARYAAISVTAAPSADLDRDTTTTLAADTGLALPLTAGLWEVTGRVHISETTVTNTVGSKARLSVTANSMDAGSSVDFTIKTGSSPTTFNSTCRPAVSGTSIWPSQELSNTSGRCTYIVSCLVKMSGSGTFNFEWAQSASSGTPCRRYSGSYLVARQVPN